MTAKPRTTGGARRVERLLARSQRRARSLAERYDDLREAARAIAGAIEELGAVSGVEYAMEVEVPPSLRNRTHVPRAIRLAVRPTARRDERGIRWRWTVEESGHGPVRWRTYCPVVEASAPLLAELVTHVPAFLEGWLERIELAIGVMDERVRLARATAEAVAAAAATEGDQER